MSRPSSALGRATLAVGVVLAAGAAAIGFAAGDGGTGGASPQRGAASWGSLAPSPLERTEVGAARIGDRVYVVGGYISSGGTTGQMARYDISENRWKEVASLPIEVNHPGFTAQGGKLYLLGGNLPGGGQGEPKSRRLYSYGPRRDRWERLPDAPTARAAMGFAAIGNKLYAAGGYSERTDRLRRLEIYDTRRDRWSTGPKMPTGRNHVGAAVERGTLDSRMVVTGGRPGPEGGSRATVEAYEPTRRRWRRLPPLETARSGHATVVARGEIIVFGGEELGPGGSTIEQVERFDGRETEWVALPDMVTPRHGLGGSAFQGRVYAIEGGPQPGLAYSSAVEFLDLR